MMEARHNSYDLLRLILAFFVLVSHAYWLTGVDKPDIYTFTSNQTYLAEVGLLGFFSLSGFLITKSFIRRKDMVQYTVNRVLRIFPGFWVCLLISAFIIAPSIYFIESGSMDNFPVFGSWSATLYIRQNFTTLINQVNIKNVLDSVNRKNLNGSIWTLHVELICYVLTVILGYLGLYKNKWKLLGFILCAYLLYLFILYDFEFIAIIKGIIPFKKAKLIMAYLSGMLIVGFEKELLGKKSMILNIILVLLVLTISPLFKLFSPIVFAIFFLGTFSLFQFNLKHDISYGVYVYAWPIQQLILVCVPGISMFSYIFFTLLFLVPISLLSYIYVENPIMKQKKKVYVSIKNRGIKTKLFFNKMT